MPSFSFAALLHLAICQGFFLHACEDDTEGQICIDFAFKEAVDSLQQQVPPRQGDRSPTAPALCTHHMTAALNAWKSLSNWMLLLADAA